MTTTFALTAFCPLTTSQHLQHAWNDMDHVAVVDDMKRRLDTARELAGHLNDKPPKSKDEDVCGHASVIKNFADALLKVEKSLGENGDRFFRFPEARGDVAEVVAWARVVENMFFGQ